ncbi:hypothetical protein B0H14DRAFT_2505078 [Mycena olivaceomarginata]|nr:hypothetical protein B0H14DRAFT_2505078 [Mycena olivaceomarginata]
MSRARNIVISMPELLEHTLTHLPMHDLLVAAPLVSKRWQAITLSPALQRALFFEPDFSVAEYIRNPLLVEMFPPFFAAPLVEEYERDEEDEEFEDDEGYEDCQLSWPGQSPALLAMPWARVPESFKRADASWRRMLVTQPPTQTMRVTHHTHSMDGGTGESRALLPDFFAAYGRSLRPRSPVRRPCRFELLHTLARAQWSRSEG